VHRYQLREAVEKYLSLKLAKNLNVASIKVPWSKMKEQDIINWPSDLKFKPIFMMDRKDLTRLYILAGEGLLDFSPEFLRRHRANQLDLVV
jgi:hypothetical protein